MSTLKYEIKDLVARISLNRPEVYNSFNKEMALELQSTLDDCATNDAVRCVVLSGEGKAFCAGQDLQEVVAEDGPELSEIINDHFNPLVIKIREMEKPVISAVNGVAAGAGANLALLCDIAVAKESASFIQAFSKIGLIPDTGGTYFLPRLIGMQRATALMMLAEKVSAKEAQEIGMIYRCFADDVFEEEVSKIANKLANMPTKGLGYIKRALNYSLTNDLNTQLGIEDQLQTLASHTKDYEEGVDAFLQKRKPIFKGA